MVSNPLDANHEHEKPGPEPSHQPSTTVEGLYMTSDIGNKKPPHLLESAPQKVGYVLCNSDSVYIHYSSWQSLQLHFVFSRGTLTKLAIFVQVHELCMHSRMRVKIFTTRQGVGQEVTFY